MRTILTLLLLLFVGGIERSAAQADTLVSVFHHNYLIERHTELLVFAEEMVAYSHSRDCSPQLREQALDFQKKLQELVIWRSEDVVGTNDSLRMLLRQGTQLRNSMVPQEQWSEAAKNLLLALLIGIPALIYYFRSWQ